MIRPYTQLLLPSLALILLASIKLSQAAILVNGSMVFNPNCTDNIVTYWGQNKISRYASTLNVNEPDLSIYCDDDTLDVINIAYITRFFVGAEGKPTINLANHCSGKFSANNPLLNCVDTTIPAAITKCQAKGKLVMVSISGLSPYNETISTKLHADYLAINIWKMFLGGTEYQEDRPFGPDVILDGVDIAIQGGSHQYWSAFADSLRYYARNDTSKYYYVSATPGCNFPDAVLGPDTFARKNTTIEMASLDWLNVIYDSNANCGYQYYGDPNPMLWNFGDWADRDYVFANTRINLGALGLPSNVSDPQNSYVEPDRLVQIVSELGAAYPKRVGGTMITDASLFVQNNFTQTINGQTQQVNFAQYVGNSLRPNGTRACGQLPSYVIVKPEVTPTPTPTTTVAVGTPTASQTSTPTSTPTPTPLDLVGTLNGMVQRVESYFKRNPGVKESMVGGSVVIAAGAAAFIGWKVKRWASREDADPFNASAGI